MVKFLLYICLLTISIFVVSGLRSDIVVKLLDDIPSDLNYEPFKRVGEKLLYFSDETANWFKANNICRSIKGFLVSIDNENAWDTIKEYLTNEITDKRRWWISANDLDSEGNFVWANTGTPMEYNAFAKSQPDDYGTNEDCVHLRFKEAKYEMNDMDCRRENHFICERETPLTILINAL
uniref:C-type lectin domain-containing protein n=1 Tax=Glossina brevipalpis TaxID=37001 RepID=A0A1A9X2Y7_9MUSC